MNKILNINLGGFPFTIDDNAYAALDNYFQTLRQHFSQSEGCDEIMSDIEGRAAEILNESMNNKQAIVSLTQAQNAIQKLGTPEDFGIETPQNNTKTSADTGGGGIPTAKRFFRDGEDKIVGGVSSGLAAYFGISDPLWVRLAFFFMLIFAGTGAFIYFVLWVITPEASSTADRLAMRGESATAENIARAVGQGAQKLGEQVENWGNSTQTQRNRNQIGAAIERIFSFLKNVIRPIGKIIAVIAMVWILIGWVTGLVSIWLASPAYQYFLPDETWKVWIGVIALFGCVILPFLSIGWWLIQVFYKKMQSNWWQGALWTVWTVCFCVVIILLPQFVRESSMYNMWSEEKTMKLPQNGDQTLYLQSDAKPFKANITLGSLWVSEDYLFNSDLPIEVIRSKDDSVRVLVRYSSSGRTREEATLLSQNINFPLRVEGNNLWIPEGVAIQKGTKFRDQRVSLVISLPRDTKIEFPDNLSRNIFNETPFVCECDDNSFEDDCRARYYDRRRHIYKLELNSKGYLTCPK